MQKIKTVAKSLLLGLIITIFSVGLAFARAGGGESFGGGGFDSGGSGGSSFDFGSSSGGNFGSLGGAGFNVGGCVPCIIFLIVIIVVIILASKGKGGSGGSTSGSAGNIPPTNRSMPPEEIEAKLKELKKIDKKFDLQKFKTHVKKVFMATQDGWTQRDQKVCRPFMAEEVYQSHQMQIDNMKRNKVINVLENIVVGSAEFARIDLDEEYHKITMKVRASMKDYKVKEDNAEKIIEGSKEQTPPFTEFWIFIRRSNLKTKIKNGIFDRKCPNCGAPIDVDVAGKCKYCDANVVNGDYDWVLSEIVQKSEWQE
jgi:hypothetical protein